MKHKPKKPPGKPLTRKALKELGVKVKQDPRLLKLFAENPEKGLESEGYFVPESFQKKLQSDVKTRQKAAAESVSPRAQKMVAKIKKGQQVKILLRINRATGTRKIEIN
jgi:hypothetical protein